jgi:hypothetical protein
VCGGRSVIFYCLVLRVIFATVHRSVWAYTRSEWADLRSVVLMGRWDKGELYSHRLYCTGAGGLSVCVLPVSTVTTLGRYKINNFGCGK